MPARIGPELAAFLQSGVSILLGTRDAALVPDCVRCAGARVERGGAALSAFVPAATALGAVANLRDNGRAAVFFSRPSDHRSIQVKGRVEELALAPATDEALVRTYVAALAAALAQVGVPLRDTDRFSRWPAWRLRLAPEAVFDQTPGPGAGAPMAAPRSAPRRKAP